MLLCPVHLASFGFCAVVCTPATVTDCTQHDLHCNLGSFPLVVTQRYNFSVYKTRTMSHWLPIAPIKTYLCKQELWPDDWLGGWLHWAICLQGVPEAWDAKPQRSIVPEPGDRLSRKERQAPKGCSVSRHHLEMQTQSTFTLEQAECIPSQRWKWIEHYQTAASEGCCTQVPLRVCLGSSTRKAQRRLWSARKASFTPKRNLDNS